MAVEPSTHVGAALAIAPGEGTPKGLEIPADAATKGVPPMSEQSLGEQWKIFLQQPGNAAAMVQFGIKAMQPISPGQSVLGHLGNAVGAGGEAKQRVVENAQEANLKKAQADYYSGRSQYYAKGGAFGQLTANNILGYLKGRDDDFTKVREKIRLYQFGGMVDTMLTPEQIMDLDRLALDEFAATYPDRLRDPRVMGAGTGTGGTLASSSVAPTPATPDSPDSDPVGAVRVYPDGSEWTKNPEGWVKTK